MTTTKLLPPRGPARTPTARAIIAVAAIGPLAVALLRGVLPYSTNDDPATVASAVAAHPAQQTAVLWLTWLALLVLPLGVLIVSRAAVRARPVLGTIAAVLAWAGFLSLFFTTTIDHLAPAAAAAGVPASTVAALSTAVDAQPAVTIATAVFVAGHILGTVLLGVALWRVVPRWAAVALAVSQPLHLLFAVVVPQHLLDALAWALTALGFAVVAASTGSPDPVDVRSVPAGGTR